MTGAEVRSGAAEGASRRATLSWALGALARPGLAAFGLTLGAAGGARASGQDRPLVLRGHAVQGGVLIGRTRPGAAVRLDGETVGAASAGGWFVIGFDRDAAPSSRLAVEGEPKERSLVIAPGVFEEQRIDGLPQDQVAPGDPALLERIKREAALKAQAFQSRDGGDGFRDGFLTPVEGAKLTGRFGARRILNGAPKTPHYGVDLAAPQGTPIRAPADGLVVLAEPDMHFEGGLTLIDHGQGLVAAYLHQSAQFVSVGDRVQRGRAIGQVGRTGRATGPHLCWRLKWRGRNLDASLLCGALPDLA